MKLFVMVKAGAKGEKVEPIDESHFRVAVKEPAQDGRANEAVLKALARYLGLAPSCLSLVRGLASKSKVIEIKK